MKSKTRLLRNFRRPGVNDKDEAPCEQIEQSLNQPQKFTAGFIL